MRKIFKNILVFSLLTGLIFLPSIPLSNAYPSTWAKGTERLITGHEFSEEYWTNGSVMLKDNENESVSMAISYVNTSGFQAFLVAFNNYTNKLKNETGTFPYQMFGMHYLTNGSEEVFITANLAYLFAYKDTYNGTGTDNIGQKLPDVGNEDFYYIFPFGKNTVNGSFNTKTEAHPVVKNGWGDYTFKMSYYNLSAKIIRYHNVSTLGGAIGFLASVYLPWAFARFSELTVEYHIKMDNQTGLVTCETFYNIGQVNRFKFWGLSLDPSFLVNSSLTLGAAHYLSIITSNYNITSKSNQSHFVKRGVTEMADDNITVVVGNNERAFDLDFHGTFDLYNETDDSLVRGNQTAYNFLMQANPTDLLFLMWQVPFSLEVFSIFAYSHSTYMQDTYSGPAAMMAAGRGNVSVNHLWYATEFPDWDGYKVVHDPTYTAHVNLGLMVGGGETSTTTTEGDNEGAGAIILLGGAAAVVIVLVVLIRRRK
ncbi:MAG: hypothetical protein ACTSUV_01325 [Candidatus Ranarchaeia archaeon]